MQQILTTLQCGKNIPAISDTSSKNIPTISDTSSKSTLENPSRHQAKKGRRGFQSLLKIPLKCAVNGQRNPEYTKMYGLCLKHRCDFPTLVARGIITDPGQPPAEDPAPGLEQKLEKGILENESPSISDKPLAQLSTLELVGRKVRQIRSDSGRQFFGIATVTGRVNGGSVIEVRDQIGQTHKILASCLEVVSKESGGTGQNAQA